MSTVKSWDSRQSEYGTVHSACDMSYTGQPVRIVAWDPAWPPQSDVPHAGTRWMSNGVVVTVLDGIPRTEGEGSWMVDCRTDLGLMRWPRISDLKPIPPKPETASGEVVGTVSVHSHGIRVIVKLPPGTYTIIKRETP